jgi:hypothetical protein
LYPNSGKHYSDLNSLNSYEVNVNSITAAQQDMREAYFRGGPGVVSSGTAWLAAGITSLFLSAEAGILTLIFGGMLIFPVSVVLCRMIGVSGKHAKNNPLAPLALEGTFWMLISIPVAVGVALYRIEWFFPAMLFIIAGRYLTFSTLYGMRIYWAFSIALIVSGWLLLSMNASASSGAFTGALVEYIFGTLIFLAHKKNDSIRH